jgi:hypothetical protein
MFYPSGRWEALAFFATPADRKHTWIFADSIRTRARHWLGTTTLKRFLTKVLEEDERITASLFCGRFPPEPEPSVRVRGDAPELAFLKLYRRWSEAENQSAES